MNDFERRALDIAGASNYLLSYTRANTKILAIESFAYNIEILAVASAGAGQGFAQIQSDSDFILTYMSATAMVSNANVAVPYTTVQITDTGSGKTFFNQPTLMSLVFGVQGFPFILPTPRVIAPNTNVKIDVNNINSAAASNYYFSLWGARVYYAG